MSEHKCKMNSCNDCWEAELAAVREELKGNDRCRGIRMINCRCCGIDMEYQVGLTGRQKCAACRRWCHRNTDIPCRLEEANA